MIYFHWFSSFGFLNIISGRVLSFSEVVTTLNVSDHSKTVNFLNVESSYWTFNFRWILTGFYLAFCSQNYSRLLFGCDGCLDSPGYHPQDDLRYDPLSCTGT